MYCCSSELEFNFRKWPKKGKKKKNTNKKQNTQYSFLHTRLFGLFIIR